MSTLQQRLDRIRAGFARKAPEEVRAVMTRATEDLRASGIVERLPSAGDPLPEFSLEDTEGRIVHSRDLLRDGPLVVTVFRGGG